MKKGLQLKLVIMFVLLVISVLLITGIFQLSNFMRTYQESFSAQISQAVEGPFARAVVTAIEDGKDIENVFLEYSRDIALSKYRSCYILNAKDGSVIASSDKDGQTVAKTPNIIHAMTKSRGDKMSFNTSFVDYAEYISGSGNSGYIIYIIDRDMSLGRLVKSMLGILFQSLGLGILISLILGFIFSKTITTPIKQLTRQAEEFSKGNFGVRLKAASKDEIGELIEGFNYMGDVMTAAIDESSAEKNKAEAIMENVTSGIIAFNTKQEIIHINTAAKKMLGISEEEIKNIRFDEFFGARASDICMAEFVYLPDRTKVEEINYGMRHIKVSFTPFRMDDEKIFGIVCVFDDFTEQFNLNEARQNFVAEVSHELKTPLTTIRTYSETLLYGYADDKEMTESFLNTIISETDKMTAMVKNLLILSKMDAQKGVMNNEVFSLDELLRGLAQQFSLEAENQNKTLTYTRLNEMPEIYADKLKLERVIKNIISNAMKYSDDKGVIKIFAGCLNNEVYFKVEDNGYGIPEEDLPHVFERFYRVNKDRARESGGTGLGLAIAKEIVEGHGGTIKIESTLGEFTRVTVRLPISGAQNEE